MNTTPAITSKDTDDYGFEFEFFDDFGFKEYAMMVLLIIVAAPFLLLFWIFEGIKRFAIGFYRSVRDWAMDNGQYD